MARPDGVSFQIRDDQHAALVKGLGAGNRLDEFVIDSTRVLALGTVSQIMRISPVDTGRLRAAFFPLYSKPWAGRPPAAKGRSGRAQAEGRRQGKAREKVRSGRIRISVVNSVNYVQFVEDLYGFIESGFKLEQRRFGREMSNALDDLVKEAKKAGARHR